MKEVKVPDFEFPVGYEPFHRKQLFSFQLNRPYSFGTGHPGCADPDPEEQAHNHCQIGNTGLTLETIVKWTEVEDVGPP